MPPWPPPRIIVALDFESSEACLRFAEQLDPRHCRLKVGKGLFTSAGPALLEKLMRLGFTIFLDLKYHDIPNTVAHAVRAAAELGVWMINVHASGGARMLAAAREALAKHAGKSPLLTAVTILTSMDQRDLHSIGIDCSPAEQVMRLAALVQDAGLDGVVCSAIETPLLRAQCGPDFCLVTPGIRPAGAMANDQRRTSSPQAAIAAGSDYLVIGRPITTAADASQALASIVSMLPTSIDVTTNPCH